MKTPALRVGFDLLRRTAHFQVLCPQSLYAAVRRSSLLQSIAATGALKSAGAHPETRMAAAWRWRRHPACSTMRFHEIRAARIWRDGRGQSIVGRAQASPPGLDRLVPVRLRCGRVIRDPMAQAALHAFGSSKGSDRISGRSGDRIRGGSRVAPRSRSGLRRAAVAGASKRHAVARTCSRAVAINLLVDRDRRGGTDRWITADVEPAGRRHGQCRARPPRTVRRARERRRLDPGGRGRIECIRDAISSADCRSEKSSPGSSSKPFPVGRSTLR